MAKRLSVEGILKKKTQYHQVGKNNSVEGFSLDAIISSKVAVFPRLDFRRSLVSGRSARSFPEQRLVIEPKFSYDAALSGNCPLVKLRHIVIEK